MTKYVYSFGARQGRRLLAHAQPARRQGLRARRDDQPRHPRAARASRSRRRRGPHYNRTGRQLPEGLWDQVVDRAREARAGRRARLRRSRAPAAGLRPLGRARVDARHDGDRPQPRPQRRDRRGPGRAGRGNERFAWDCYRRFITMFGDVVLDIRREAFDEQLDALKKRLGVADRPRGAGRRAARARRRPTRTSSHERTGAPFPQDPHEQLRLAVQRRLRLLVRQEGHRVPAHQRHPGRLGHRGHRDVDGLRQPRRDLRHGRRLHARSPHRRAALLRRVPRQRPGRGRGGGHPHARAHRRPAARACRTIYDELLADRRPPRAPLQGHAGHRVHDPGGQALPPADALRQALGARPPCGWRWISCTST